jgi:2,3-bisphosphoglycerate-independent phosphoglycerate mutase
MDKKVCLIIMDGWGKGRMDESNAIYQANTPFVDSLESSAAVGQLLTDGENVGLPAGQMGNSEVGHMNIGAGRVVYQDLLRINKAVKSGDFMKERVLVDALNHAKENKVSVHFIGLVSEGGVHSSQGHLHALCDLAAQMKISKSFIHAFTDGRDCDPKSGLTFIKKLEQHLEGGPTRIASVIGRYYAMDRDKRWERVAKAYNLLVSGKGKECTSASEAIEQSYISGVTDEFIEPCTIRDAQGDLQGTIALGDVVICFNFRTDRCREITEVLTQKDHEDQGMTTLGLYYVTMTNYDRTFKNVRVVYDKENLKNTLGEVLANAGKTQVRIAETEKYPHVTFFFNGGRELNFEGESRIMVNSPKVATYDLQPEMSAPEVTQAICERMQEEQPDFVCLNFANPDMVGHTGVFEAIKKACETTDSSVREVVRVGKEMGYSFIIIADHGNADYAINDDGSPNTAHSLNPVPMYILDPNTSKVGSGILADVAPTILALMNVQKPKEMTGKNLVVSD